MCHIYVTIVIPNPVSSINKWEVWMDGWNSLILFYYWDGYAAQDQSYVVFSLLEPVDTNNNKLFDGWISLQPFTMYKCALVISRGRLFTSSPCFYAMRSKCSQSFQKIA